MASPERMCVVCRKMQEKKNLLRIVKNKEGEIKVDDNGKMQGRGAYICATKTCFDKLVRTKGLERSFKCTIPPEVFTAVNEKIGE